jgi:GT2 family glycosyltransferase
MKFSVIVPTYRRPAALRDLLRSIGALDYPRDQFEVLVVDDGGGVPDQLVAEAAPGVTIKLLAQEHAGPATARNRGIAGAAGQYLAFTDDDCIVDPGWLKAYERALAAHPTSMIGGSTRNDDESSAYADASQCIVDFLYEYYGGVDHSNRFFATNNLACRRDLLVAIGGFDESFPRAAAEDRDLCERWRAAGWTFQEAHDARVIHVLRLSASRYVRQHLRYGQGATYLHKARARRGVPRPRLEPLRFYWRLVTWPLRTANGGGPRAAALMVLAAVSQAAYALGYYSERMRGVRRATVEAGPTPVRDATPVTSRAVAP